MVVCGNFSHRLLAYFKTTKPCFMQEKSDMVAKKQVGFTSKGETKRFGSLHSLFHKNLFWNMRVTMPNI